MCRLFAQISPRPTGASRLLADSAFSLLRQSDFNKKNLQKDGWGLAWFGNRGEVTVSKSPRPVYKEASAFKDLAARVRSHVVIGHIRAASNPRGVPKKRLINWENTQPFTDGRWAFAHNGTLFIPQEVSDTLGPYRRRLKSLNDSEVLFWLFIKNQDRLGDAAAALKASVSDVWRTWRRCRGRHPGRSAPYSSLNALVSDGRELHALNHYVGRGLAEHGVCNPDQPWYVMSFLRRGGVLAAASENLDRGRWTRMKPTEILSARISGGRLRVSRRRWEAPLPS